MKIFLNLSMKKGFTLFTALVGVLLILIAVLLVQAMNNTQKSASITISESRIDQEMIDTANIARGDYLAQFNFGIRSAVESYFNYAPPNDNAFILTEDLWESSSSFDGIVEQFTQDNFHSSTISPFAQQAADSIKTAVCGDYTSICDAKNTSEYLIRITDFDADLMKAILETVISNSSPFLEPIDCGIDECQKGTFYLNMDFSSLSLSETDYEDLPQIEVIKKSTCRLDPTDMDVVPVDIQIDRCTKSIKLPVIPRSNMRILVPLRVFKGIVEARLIARDLFLPGDVTQAALMNAKLGVCDSGPLCCRPAAPASPYIIPNGWSSCMARNDPFALQTQTNFSGDICIITRLDTESIPDPLQRAGELFNVNLQNVPDSGVNEYNPSSINDTQEKLRQIVLKEILDKDIVNAGNYQSTLTNDPSLFQLSWNADLSSYFFTPSFDTQAFLSREYDVADATVILDPPDLSSRCTKLIGVNASLVFEELDPLYSISSDPSVEPFKLKVQIINGSGNFLPFGSGENEKTGVTCSTFVNGPLCNAPSIPPTCAPMSLQGNCT